MQPVVRDEWIKIGLCTDPANRPEAERGIRLCYEIAGLTPPSKIVWYDSPHVMHAAIKQHNPQYVFGQHEAGWLSMYAYFKDVCGLVDETKKLEGLWLIAKNAGWFAPFEDECHICDRPCLLKRDDEGRLHSTDGPALAYRDRVGIWSIHGVRVKKYVVEAPETITVEDIENEQNAEVRRVKIDQYGYAKYIQDSGAVELHRDITGVLYRKEVPGDESITAVKVLNSTPEPDGSLTRDEALKEFVPETPIYHDGAMIRLDQAPASYRFKLYFLRVPPDTTTARAGVAWTCGKTAEAYDPYMQS